MNIQKKFILITMAVICCSINIKAYFTVINPMLIPMIQRRIVRITPVLIPVYRQLPPLLIGALAQRSPSLGFNFRINL